MAKKLKDLHITSVSFVDEGANPKADIVFFKGRNGKGPAGSTAEPDPKEPAPGPGDDDLFKGFISSLKEAGVTDEQIAKASVSFNQVIARESTEAISNEIWDTTYALRESLNSILTDTDLDAAGKTSKMMEQIAQFNTMIGSCIPKWCAGHTSGYKAQATEAESAVALMRGDADRLSSMVEKISKRKDPAQNSPKGEDDMIDKSRFTAEELAQYEALVAKAKVDDPAPADPTPAPAPKAPETPKDDGVAKGKETPAAAPQPTVEPEIVALLKQQIQETKDALAKMKDENLTSEMTMVAKKYEPLGKKSEELVPMLKKMKEAGDDLYNSYIAALDQQLDIQKQSGIFGEIGKSTSGAPSGSVEDRWIAKAREIMKSNPNLTMAQAKDQAYLDDPQLAAELDEA